MHGMIKFQIMEGKKLAEEGRRKARERGVKFGRPTVCCSEVVERIISLRDSGMGIKKIADDCKVGIGTVYKAIKSKEINVTI
jgi:DNA invertase Pin-like site-specific DNA recombinase